MSIRIHQLAIQLGLDNKEMMALAEGPPTLGNYGVIERASRTDRRGNRAEVLLV